MILITRRSLLRALGPFTAMSALPGGVSAAAGDADAPRGEAAGLNGVRALFFDVFGTLVDWRGGVAREAQRLLQPLGFELDWLAFADAWRGQYQPSMEEVRAGRLPFAKLDVIHRRMLERVRPAFGLTQLDEPVLRKLTLAWHRLDAWPDVPASLGRLSRRFYLAPVSNGNIALMADLARRNGFRWDAILGAEVARDYKPKPVVYLTAAEALNLAPEGCMMVAAHSYDLKAAAALGLRTAHVTQPDEYGPGTGEKGPAQPVDYAAASFSQLADLLQS